MEIRKSVCTVRTHQNYLMLNNVFACSNIFPDNIVKACTQSVQLKTKLKYLAVSKMANESTSQYITKTYTENTNFIGKEGKVW